MGRSRDEREAFRDLKPPLAARPVWTGGRSDSAQTAHELAGGLGRLGRLTSWRADRVGWPGWVTSWRAVIDAGKAAMSAMSVVSLLSANVSDVTDCHFDSECQVPQSGILALDSVWHLALWHSRSEWHLAV